MKTVLKLISGRFEGNITAPPSKSCSHRIIIASCLGKNNVEIRINELCEDVKATISCLNALGADFSYEKGILTVFPIKKRAENVVLNVNDSLSTLRFMLPLSLVLCSEAEFTGCDISLMQPVAPLCDELKRKGFIFPPSFEELPVKIRGNLEPGLYNLKGDYSSQFISSLLMSLPLLKRDSEIAISLPLFKKSYVTLTMNILKECGVKIEKGPGSIFICGNQSYDPPSNYKVEGDFSLASFFLILGCRFGDIEVSDLPSETFMGERRIIPIIRAFGGNILKCDSSFRACKSRLSGISLNLSDSPDLIPPAVVLGLLSEGKTVLEDINFLSAKDRLRLSNLCTSLKKLSAHIEEKENILIIKGDRKLKGGAVSSFNDHRIAMALACLSPICEEPLIIEGAECVNRSCPSFFEDFQHTGGKVFKIKE